MLFSFPSFFDPDSTIELITVASLHTEFAKRNVKCIALVCETVEFCKRWIKDTRDTHNTSISFPIISDIDSVLAIKLSILDRSVKNRNGLQTLAGSAGSSTCDHLLLFSWLTGDHYQSRQTLKGICALSSIPCCTRF